MSKYIDLGPWIFNTTGIGMPSEKRLASIHCVLNWLDEHPDQVPGRTITESRAKELGYFHQIGKISHVEYAEHMGTTVVPDPEPTNAELLRADIGAFYAQSVAELADGHGLEHFLSKRGWTKAPGGETDEG